MFPDWIAPTTIESFMSSHLHRNAWAQPTSVKPHVDWDVLAHVLGQNDAKPDVIVCARGLRLAFPAPRDLDELRAYMRMGIGLCLRNTQDCHPTLGRIAESFRARFAGAVQVQLFVTPGYTHGFGWHYDAEDVFIEQSIGSKEYYFRDNTIERDTAFPPRDFKSFHRETSQLQTALLIPGDFLYIPARWWHMAVAREDSLSISVGVMPD